MLPPRSRPLDTPAAVGGLRRADADADVDAGGGEFDRLLEQGVAELGLPPLSAAQARAMALYRDMLLDWNANRMNLTRLTAPRDVAVEHFVDSLSLLAAVPMRPGAALLDIGAGAGFPSLPVKIARPDLRVTLLEATAKKLRFCEAVAAALRLTDVRLAHGRAEETRDAAERGTPMRSFDVVTARAVADLGQLAAWCAPYLRPRTGVIAALKGARAADEAREAEGALRALRLRAETCPVALPGSERAHAIVICRQMAAAAAAGVA